MLALLIFNVGFFHDFPSLSVQGCPDTFGFTCISDLHGWLPFSVSSPLRKFTAQSFGIIPNHMASISPFDFCIFPLYPLHRLFPLFLCFLVDFFIDSPSIFLSMVSWIFCSDVNIRFCERPVFNITDRMHWFIISVLSTISILRLQSTYPSLPKMTVFCV